MYLALTISGDEAVLKTLFARLDAPHVVDIHGERLIIEAHLAHARTVVERLRAHESLAQFERAYRTKHVLWALAPMTHTVPCLSMSTEHLSLQWWGTAEDPQLVYAELSSDLSVTLQGLFREPALFGQRISDYWGVRVEEMVIVSSIGGDDLVQTYTFRAAV